MAIKDFNEKVYLNLILKYQSQYLKEFNVKYNLARDKIYCLTVFNRDVLSVRISEIKNTIPYAEVLYYIMNIVELDNRVTRFRALQSFCEKNKSFKLHKIASDIAEYEALLLVWDLINKVDTRIDKNPNKEVEDSEKADFGNTIKPYFKLDSIPDIFEILKNYFSPEDQDEFLRIIKTWGSAKELLTFKGNGNKLADAFRKLLEGDYIINCRKKDLEIWIIQNYQYIDPQKRLRRFTAPYIQKCISRNDYPCKNPILKIEDHSILRNR